MNEKTLPFARSFRDLIVYQRQRQLARQIFDVSKSFPGEEAFSLTDQVRRSSRSIGAPIAEAWAKRDYERHFLSKLTDADAEQNETQHWIETAQDCAYLNAKQVTELLALCDEIGRMIRSMKSHSADFCPNESTRLKETPEFFTAPLSTEN
ncbi:MAG: four helix bundle protein [Chthoniobacter sp.]|uniref:four helix bundle protein n=1 Tax=Chthoniobacter sp. TaxID=2510640 RepID=UPI0032ACEB01